MCSRDKGRVEGVTVGINNFMMICYTGEQRDGEVVGGGVGSSEGSMISGYRCGVVRLLWKYIGSLPQMLG